MTFDRQPLAFFDRRPEDRMMIHITAIRAIAPSRIHSHVSDEVVLAAGEVVGEGAGVVGGGAVVGATVAGVVAGTWAGEWAWGQAWWAWGLGSRCRSLPGRRWPP